MAVGQHVQAREPAFRLYVDEVGNHDLTNCEAENRRQLSLTGVAVDLAYARDVLTPKFDDLKRRYFTADPDAEPVIFHRSEMKYRQGAFAVLRDPETCARFDAELYALLEELDFVVLTAVIDKLAHREKYKVWRAHPYHYCMEVLLERYARWLREKRSIGDVMAESRGRKEDKALKQAFSFHYERGCGYVSAQDMKRALTSGELKVKPKPANIAGLQLADLVAHPSWRGMRAAREATVFEDSLSAKIARLLQRSKYRRSPGGTVDGFGTKWLP